MKFYGTNELGTVPKNNWIRFSESAFRRLVTENNLKRKIFHRAVSELLYVLCRLCILQYDSSLFDLLGESYQLAPHVRTHPPVAAGSQDRDQEGGPLQEPPHLLTPEARDTAEGSAVQASDTAENNVKVKDVSNVTIE